MFSYSDIERNFKAYHHQDFQAGAWLNVWLYVTEKADMTYSKTLVSTN